MRNFEQVKRTFLLLCAISVAFVSCDDQLEQNNTKTVALRDPNVDATVKAALENGSVSEVVVRKDLLLFPVNAPNLVIAHTQEIHAVPQKIGPGTTDGKPTAAEVAEVNEYSLSQLVSTNNTDNNNGTEGKSISIPASSFPNGSENNSVLEPGKLLEIVSGFNFSNGLATENVTLPNEVQNFSLPKQSIADLLSKSLPQPDTPMTMASTFYVAKRSINSKDDDVDISDSKITEDTDSTDSNSTEADDSSSKSTSDDGSNSNSAEAVKRSIDSDEDDDDSSKSNSNEDNGSSSNSTTVGGSSSNSTKVVKRSADSEEDNDDDSTSNSTEYYDHVE